MGQGRDVVSAAGYPCVATVELLRDVADKRSDRRKLLKNVRGGTIIRLPEGAPPRSRARTPEASLSDFSRRNRSARPSLTTRSHAAVAPQPCKRLGRCRLTTPVADQTVPNLRASGSSRS